MAIPAVIRAAQVQATEMDREQKNPELPTKDSSQSGAVSPDNPIDKAIDTIKKYVPKMGDDNVETTALCIMGMSGFLLLALWSDKKKKKIEKN